MSWSRLSTHGGSPSGRIGHTAVQYRRNAGRSGGTDIRYMYLFGGTDRQQFFHDLYYLNFDAKMSWRVCPTGESAVGQVELHPRVGHTATTVKMLSKGTETWRDCTLMLGGHNLNLPTNPDSMVSTGFESKGDDGNVPDGPADDGDMFVFMPQTVDEAKQAKLVKSRSRGGGADGGGKLGAIEDVGGDGASRKATAKLSDYRSKSGGEEFVGKWMCQSARGMFAKGDLSGPLFANKQKEEGFTREVNLTSHTATYVPEFNILLVFGGGSISTTDPEHFGEAHKYTTFDGLWELNMSQPEWTWKEVKQPPTKGSDPVRMDWPAHRLGHTAAGEQGQSGEVGLLL